MNSRKLLLLVSLGFLAGTVGAQAATIATFSDPSPGGQVPVFVQAGNLLTGGWNAPGLNLVLPFTGNNYPNARFEMNPVSVATPGAYPTLLGPGAIRFYDAADNLVLQITFESATLDVLSFGATAFLGRDHVTITGVGIPAAAALRDQTFAFGLANASGTPPYLSWTAAFTCSATVIPEPAGWFLLLTPSLVPRRRHR